MQLWLSLFWKPFFPALFPYGSYFSYEQQASLPFTLNCPRQPPVEMHWAKGWERQGAHSNVTDVPVTFWRKAILQKWNCTWHLHSEPHTPQCHLLLHFPHTHPHSHRKLTGIRGPTAQPPTGVSVPGQECKFIQCWSLQQMLEHQSGFVWGIDLSLLHPWTNLKTSTQSHIQTWRLFLNC